ncbi:MAG: DUF2095 domain-containing protein [Candidatus Thorarchaeota archaeon]|nr:MAG: DUF2095 domain-containing protein [Candidatus Thorarchaeota archaeon]
MSEDDEFRRNFPALSKELEEENTQAFPIDGVRTVSEESESKDEEKINYTPDVVDYIRRCDTLTQANEIVDFLAKQGEITDGQARAIKSQLKSDGIRSFGAKKEKDHYLHHGLE